MRKTCILFSFLFFLFQSNAQIIPLGFHLSIHGKLVYLAEEPYDSNDGSDCVAEITCNETYIGSDDWDYVLKNEFTIVEYPSSEWYGLNSNAPSHKYDTAHEYNYPFINFYGLAYTFDSTYFSYVIDTTMGNIVVPPKTMKSDFFDITNGLGITAENEKMLKGKLRNYADTYFGKTRPYEVELDVYNEFSEPDSIVGETIYYDCLADELVFYEFDQNDRMTSAVGYHWGKGVQLDTMRYDARGNMTWFLSEEIGNWRNDYQLEYDQFNRVSKITHTFCYIVDTEENDFMYVDVTKFGYDDLGLLNSKSTLNDDGSWSTCKFERKLKESL